MMNAHRSQFGDAQKILENLSKYYQFGFTRLLFFRKIL